MTRIPWMGYLRHPLQSFCVMTHSYYLKCIQQAGSFYKLRHCLNFCSAHFFLRPYSIILILH
ncbi:hypothetical protein BDW59DRAFT_152747, partial [Aspergillus cavernicola]